VLLISVLAREHPRGTLSENDSSSGKVASKALSWFVKSRIQCRSPTIRHLSPTAEELVDISTGQIHSLAKPLRAIHIVKARRDAFAIEKIRGNSRAISKPLSIPIQFNLNGSALTNAAQAFKEGQVLD
jgi:hypothetical protein